MSAFKRLAIRLLGEWPVRFYRGAISPLFPATCRFTPTCSEYAIQAFREWGLWRGWQLTAKRIARCHPGGGHGYDPVPRKNTGTRKDVRK